MLPPFAGRHSRRLWVGTISGCGMKPFDESGAFKPVVHGDGIGLRTLAVRSAGITTISQGLKVVLQVIATVVLARLLTPSEFGIMTMVTTFSLLFVNFGLNGFTEAVIQREDIDHALASSLFWVNLGLCTCLTIIFAACGPLMAWFYHDSRVTGVAEATALTIFFTGLSVMHIALLRRGMRFSAVSMNEILAQVSSVVVTIVLAYQGWGYWALVVGAVTLPIVTAASAWAQCQWIPGLPRRTPGTGAMVRFALNIYGYFTVNYFSRNLDNLLIGSFFGSQALGYYKKAFDLAIFPIVQASSPLNAVAVPTLSRLTGDPERYCRYILRSLSILALLGMGTGACLTLVGKDLILVLLGPKWEESGRIFMFFAPGIGAMFIYRIAGWLHLSMGSANRFFRWGMIEFAVLASLFVLSLRWGPAGVGMVWGASCWILTIPAILYAPRPAELTLAKLLGVVWQYVLASALAAGACVAILHWLPWRIEASGASGGIARILTTSSLFSLLYLGAIVLLHGAWTPLLEIGALIRDVLPRRKLSVPPTSVAASARL
jgi:O-antigen/teichoic acid export membrane protein